MMDFEAWWAKQEGIVLRMSTPELIARAAYNQGRIDRKEACIEVVKPNSVCCDGLIKTIREGLVEEIRKL